MKSSICLASILVSAALLLDTAMVRADSGSSISVAAADNAIAGSAPEPASGCSATDDLCDRIVVAWVDNSADETGFRIYRDGIFLQAAAANATIYVDTPPAGSYEYRVVATRDGNDADPSNTDQGVRLPDPGPISAPVVTGPSNGAVCPGTGARLAWHAVAGATEYSVTLIKSYGPRDGEPLTTNSTSVQLRDLIPGTNYSWCVRAFVGRCAVSEPSPWVEFVVGDAPNSANVRLLSPANDANTTAGRLGFDWEDIAGAASYRCKVMAGTGVVVSADSRDSNCLLDLAATAAGRYSWSVEAYNECGALLGESAPRTIGLGGISGPGVPGKPVFGF